MNKRRLEKRRAQLPVETRQQRQWKKKKDKTGETTLNNKQKKNRKILGTELNWILLNRNTARITGYWRRRGRYRNVPRAKRNLLPGFSPLDYIRYSILVYLTDSPSLSPFYLLFLSARPCSVSVREIRRTFRPGFKFLYDVVSGVVCGRVCRQLFYDRRRFSTKYNAEVKPENPRATHQQVFPMFAIRLGGIEWLYHVILRLYYEGRMERFNVSAFIF